MFLLGELRSQMTFSCIDRTKQNRKVSYPKTRVYEGASIGGELRIAGITVENAMNNRSNGNKKCAAKRIFWSCSGRERDYLNQIKLDWCIICDESGWPSPCLFNNTSRRQRTDPWINSAHNSLIPILASSVFSSLDGFRKLVTSCWRKYLWSTLKFFGHFSAGALSPVIFKQSRFGLLPWSVVLSLIRRH